MHLLLQDKPKEIEVHNRDLLKKVENQIIQLQNGIDSIEGTQNKLRKTIIDYS